MGAWERINAPRNNSAVRACAAARAQKCVCARKDTVGSGGEGQRGRVQCFSVQLQILTLPALCARCEGRKHFTYRPCAAAYARHLCAAWAARTQSGVERRAARVGRAPRPPARPARPTSHRGARLRERKGGCKESKGPRGGAGRVAGSGQQRGGRVGGRPGRWRGRVALPRVAAGQGGGGRWRAPA